MLQRSGNRSANKRRVRSLNKRHRPRTMPRPRCIKLGTKMGTETGMKSRTGCETDRKCLKRLAPQVGFEPTTLRLTAEFHPFGLSLPALDAYCRIELNLLPHKNF